MKRSRYAQKQARKLGGGTVDPRWQWWTIGDGAPPRPIGTAPPGPVAAARQHDRTLRRALARGLR